MSPPGAEASDGRTSGALPIVAHVLPYDQARGAQRYARDLVAHLGVQQERNLIMTIFEGEATTLGANTELGVPRGRLREVGFDPRAVIRMRNAMQALGPDLVVAHGGESAKYAAFALPRETPLIYLNIGSSHPRLGRSFSSALHRRYTKRADVIVAVSKAIADEAVRLHGIPADKVVVIANGRDPEVYSPDLSERTSTTLRLVWIGQLDTTKRPEVFIDLVAELRDEGLDIEAILIGDGPRRDELRPRAERARVDMVGRRDDVPAILAGADLLVFTGRPPEGMPGVLIEAGMCGIASVSTRVPGADEVVDDGTTGLLVDVADTNSLVDAARRLAVDDMTRRVMGENARQRCVERFSFEATTAIWHQLFDRLLAS